MAATKFTVLLMLSFVFFTSTSNAVKVVDPQAELLSKVAATYRNADLVEMTVERRITSNWKPKEEVSKGKMFYAHGKIRWEIQEPDKNWTIYDGKTFWNIEFANSDFGAGAKNRVTESTVEKKNKF